MIQNNKELQITKDWAKSFGEAMMIAISLDTETDPIKRQLYIDAHKAMIEQFSEEIAEYEDNPINWEIY